MRFPDADPGGLWMVVAMAVRDFGGRSRDDAGDGAAAARERAMGTVGRDGNYGPVALLRRLPAALSQALDHDDNLRAGGSNLDDGGQRVRLLSRSFSRRLVGGGHQHDDDRR